MIQIPTNQIMGVTPDQVVAIATQICAEQADFNLWWKAAIAFSLSAWIAEWLGRLGVINFLVPYYEKLPWNSARGKAAQKNKSNQKNEKH